ncbi:plasmid pRiA4b ORF-3 family protein [Candidatus Magnetobacterium bavaricum]|uniref:Plasmid pRiA4b ORF-3 family protein n=1 Tax=Candidatus Magnetobacterium bavaricum TaxID=29290 RepID=A0A0F3GS59_9BACT|nr:plasmid pRiA4b ORF-3 family protein [Candidatus Magnetobacterium bavaricum]
MTNKFTNVYQFKITLRGIKPPIWRRVQVPETFTFGQLHSAIQDSMGWDGDHLHAFEIGNPKTGLKDSIGETKEDGYLESKITIPMYFSMDNRKALYTYDFGDNWEHNILLEKILPRKVGVKYPTCVAGKRACPPDDCGGPWGYEELLDIISDPQHSEYDNMIEWIGEDFDPERFHTEAVIFRMSV